MNYRYQLVRSGETRLAVAPRLSLLLPTGNHILGRGYGGARIERNLPFSIQHSRRSVTDWNAGATWVAKARNEHDETSGTVALNLGQSVVWLATTRVNFLMETLWTTAQKVSGPHRTAWSKEFYVSPGIRWAYNFKSGLQIVAGVAMPIGIGPCAGEKGLVM